MNTMEEQKPKWMTAQQTNMCLVIHAAERPAEACIDGRGILIPPNEIWEVPSLSCMDHNNNGPAPYTTPARDVMKELLSQCWIFGLVEVPVIKEAGRFGLSYKFDEVTAHRKAQDALIAAEEKMLLRYVTIQRERMSQNLPALPPGGRVAEVIAKRKIDLQREYNLNPVGFGTVAKAAAAVAEMDELRRQNEELKAMVAEAMAQFNKKKEKSAKETDI